MKRSIITLLFITAFSLSAQAGFVSGNSSPYVSEQGRSSTKLGTSVLMTGTPLSTVCFTAKYAITESTAAYGRLGVGSIDYTTVSATKLTTDPAISMIGLEYMLSGIRKTEFYAVVLEYETASWGINKQNNTSNEIMIGLDYTFPVNNFLRTRYRIGFHRFEAGQLSEQNISTSTKYSLSSELDYLFTPNYTGSFGLSVYFGDKVGGLISSFGLGLGFNL